MAKVSVPRAEIARRAGLDESVDDADTLVDFVLRVASPVLCAFIVLALRARAKR